MSRKAIIAGNWKMHKTNQEAVEFIQKLAPQVEDSLSSIYLAVPFTAIEPVVKAAEKTNIIVGAQNMNEAAKGAFTGEIAGIMLKEAGAEFVLLGHSERRHVFNETDETINKKVIRALKDGLQPILCIGETEEEREEEKTEKVLEGQLKKGLKSVSEEEMNTVIIAYEPVWAIGTGKTATPSMAEEAHKMIREVLKELYSNEIAEQTPILYGGSVKPDNVKELMDEEDIDGALVGGASLEADSFASIINQCV